MATGTEGTFMHALARKLFPICRSITGNGVRESLKIIQKNVPLKILQVPSGTKVFDWRVPPEWNIRDAYVADERGRRVIDFKKNNLHIVGYSVPIDTRMSLPELQKHLHSLPDQPNAIPYVTSYYKRMWGFCLSHVDRVKLKKGMYRVVIKSTLKRGHLTYGELIIPGKQKEEILLSTYICHPSMANNELSGPVMATALAKFIASKKRRYTYRIVFVPETIGSITYLSKNIDAMKKSTVAGFNLTCCGDERVFSLMPSRYGNTVADKVARRILKTIHPKFRTYSFLERGSDERQYGSALVDLPVASIMRSKYGTYPEYHTSLDDLKLVTARGLQGTFDVYRACIEYLEKNRRYIATVKGEPQLGVRGMYKTEGKAISSRETRTIVDVLAYADGTNDLHDLSDMLGVSDAALKPVIARLQREKLLREV